MSTDSVVVANVVMQFHGLGGVLRSLSALLVCICFTVGCLFIIVVYPLNIPNRGSISFTLQWSLLSKTSTQEGVGVLCLNFGLNSFWPRTELLLRHKNKVKSHLTCSVLHVTKTARITRNVFLLWPLLDLAQ